MNGGKKYNNRITKAIWDINGFDFPRWVNKDAQQMVDKRIQCWRTTRKLSSEEYGQGYQWEVQSLWFGIKVYETKTIQDLKWKWWAGWL
jgi:hypothetical protein